MGRHEAKSPQERHLALRLAYDGRRYSGWQYQTNARTVQGELELALTRLLKAPTKVRGCSRTDAGVHARGHVSDFFTSSRIPTERLPLALNTLLPGDIRCLQAREVPQNFHARFQARGKTYSYQIWNAPYLLPDYRLRAYHESRPLDLGAMCQALPSLLGLRDFKAMQATGSPATSTLRRIYSIHILTAGRESYRCQGGAYEPARWGGTVGEELYPPQVYWPGEQWQGAFAPGFVRPQNLGVSGWAEFPWQEPARCSQPPRHEAQPRLGQGQPEGAVRHWGPLSIVVHASGFLYNMMRILAGTLVYIGLHKLSLAELEAALAEGRRKGLGKTLGPEGLCLEAVDYAPDDMACDTDM